MKTILFQGDSITDAGRDFQNDAQLGYGYANMTAGKIAVDYPGQYKMINKGISGNRIVDVYARMKADIINLDPSYMSILIGVNDVWHELEWQNGVAPEKFERVYDWLITELKEAKPDLQILILEPFVLKGPATEHAWEEFWSETLLRSAACKRLAEKHGLVFIPLQEKLEQLADATSTTYVLGDGVHPTYAGHELISREVYKVYQNLL
jgi:lysophospholipase L1-like esterase